MYAAVRQALLLFALQPRIAWQLGGDGDDVVASNKTARR